MNIWWISKYSNKARENNCQKKQPNLNSDLHSLWVTSRVKSQLHVKLELQTIFPILVGKKGTEIFARKNLT